jgi:hypothetical protein
MKDALKRAGLAKQEPAPRKISKEFREELSDDESLPPRFEGPAMTVAMPLGETAPPRPTSRAPDDGDSAAVEEADAPTGDPEQPPTR